MSETKEIKGFLQFDGELSITSINQALYERFPIENPAFYEKPEKKVFWFQIGKGKGVSFDENVGVVLAISKEQAQKEVNDALIDFDVQIEDIHEFPIGGLKMWNLGY